MKAAHILPEASTDMLVGDPGAGAGVGVPGVGFKLDIHLEHLSYNRQLVEDLLFSLFRNRPAGFSKEVKSNCAKQNLFRRQAIRSFLASYLSVIRELCLYPGDGFDFHGVATVLVLSTLLRDEFRPANLSRFFLNNTDFKLVDFGGILLFDFPSPRLNLVSQKCQLLLPSGLLLSPRSAIVYRPDVPIFPRMVVSYCDLPFLREFLAILYSRCSNSFHRPNHFFLILSALAPQKIYKQAS